MDPLENLFILCSVNFTSIKKKVIVTQTTQRKIPVELRAKYYMYVPWILPLNKTHWGFPSGPVVNPGDTGSSPGPGRSHMPQGS